jgi:hypothetical protein
VGHGRSSDQLAGTLRVSVDASNTVDRRGTALWEERASATKDKALLAAILPRLTRGLPHGVDFHSADCGGIDGGI